MYSNNLEVTMPLPPVRHDGKIKVLPGERFTPYTLAVKLKAKAILESSSFIKGKERYSILLVTEAFKAIQRPAGVYLKLDGKELKVNSAGTAKKDFDILDVCRYFSTQHPPVRQDFPCPTGGIGFLSYEFAARCDTIRVGDRPDPTGLDEAVFMFGHVFVVFDHYTDIMYLIGINYREHEIDLDAAMADIEARINDMDFNYLSREDASYPATVVSGADDRKAYMAGVEAIKAQIRAGNLLQGVLSRRLTVETKLTALQAYRSLRSKNPSPYLFYLDFGDYRLFGASPEVQVKAKAGTAVLKPIAGTRRRGATAAEDKALEAELLADEKEKAEHLMLIDLARNDLGRICKPGTVKVTDYMAVERYSHVMHLVSRVEGELLEGVDSGDLVRATFPAGTVSGAPKIRAIETIDSLEPQRRGFYAGLVGYFESEGGMDSCITIRSGLEKDGKIILQAGAGIVYDSRPEREYEETCEKLRALAVSVGVEV
jgi:anthranilate synthase component 1